MAETVRAVEDHGADLAAMIRQLGDWQHNGTWNALTEMVSLVSALRDSATPHLAERLGHLAVGLGQMAGEAGPGVAETVRAVEDHGADLAAMIRQLGAWQQDGTWDALMQLVTLAKGLQDSLTPHLVERLVSFAGDAVSDLRAALDSGLLDLGIRATHALSDVTETVRNDTSRVT
ncbi:DUF1641 domain-containing protein, partial [Sulfobacillus sp. DSM 109850]|nr:DUF1641 domain-containing protein [Sulfobacillus harzensis]